MITFEHQETGGDWLPVSDADELAQRLFLLGGRGRVVLDTRGGDYVMEGPE